MARLAITGGTVLTMDPGDRILAPGFVLVEESALAQVGGGDPSPAQLEGAEVLDASGCVVMPGLVNAHTHVAMTLMRGYADDMPVQEWLEQKIWPLESHLQPDDVYWGSLLGMAEMLLGGTTCFNDMYHFFEATARAIVDSGIRGCPSGVLLGIVPWARQMLADAKHFVADWKGAGEGRVHPFFGPHALYTCPDELLLEVAEAARDLRVPMHVHLAETEAHRQRAFEAYGKSPVQHLASLGLLDQPVLAAHCVWVDEQDIAALAAKQTGVSLNVGSNLKLGSGVPPIEALLAAGVRVGLGTDGAASNNNLSMLEETRLAALVAKGANRRPEALPAYEALKLATLGGARALGLEALIGSREAGKQADLVVVSMEAAHLLPVHNAVSHLAYSAMDSDIRDVFVAGRALVRNRQLLTIDLGEVHGKVEESLGRLLSS